MPTYDYRCEKCGHEFAEFQSITEDALKICPECEEPQLRRLIGAGAGIIFRGSGFYETDYKRARKSSDGGGKGDGGGEKKSSSSSSSTEKKSDSGSKSDSSKSSGDS